MPACPSLTPSRCLEGLAGSRGSAGGVWHGSLVWACSSAGHALPAAVLEQLVPPAASAVCTAWQAGDRGAAGGGILLAQGLARQPAGSEVAAVPAVAAALARLLPLVAADVECVASGEALPQVGGCGWGEGGRPGAQCSHTVASCGIAASL